MLPQNKKIYIQKWGGTLGPYYWTPNFSESTIMSSNKNRWQPKTLPRVLAGQEMRPSFKVCFKIDKLRIKN